MVAVGTARFCLLVACDPAVGVDTGWYFVVLVDDVGLKLVMVQQVDISNWLSNSKGSYNSLKSPFEAHHV